MKDESLSKFYVAVTRARYSVAFVYKTKQLPSNDIGTSVTVEEEFCSQYIDGYRSLDGTRVTT